MFATFLVYVVSFIIQLVWIWVIFSRLGFKKENDKLQFNQPVSVVVFTGDHFSNFQQNVEEILAQDYADFELVVVDNSEDEELRLYLNSLSKQHKNLQVVTINDKLNFFKGRKFPISVGIKSAHNDIVILTEPVCKPADSKWIEEIQGNFNKLTDIVLGYSTYYPTPGVKDKLIRFDNLLNSMKFFSMALAGAPYMGSGRNLAYRRSLFFEKKGLINHYLKAEGDSDLFVNEVATSQNTKVEVSKSSYVVQNAPLVFKEWVRNKRRALLSNRYYKRKHRLIVNSFSVSFFLLLLTFPFLIGYQYLVYPVLGIFAFRLFSMLYITKKCMVKLNEKELLLISPLIEVYLLISSILFRFKGKKV